MFGRSQPPNIQAMDFYTDVDGTSSETLHPSKALPGAQKHDAAGWVT